MTICVECGRPKATDQDYETVPEGQGEHLCWDTHCEHPRPVTIAHCSECGWHEAASGDSWLCNHPRYQGDPVAAFGPDAPPASCPLRKP